MKLTKVLAVWLEGIGCTAVLVGILIEVNYQAHMGFVAITAGSLSVAVGSMLFAKLILGERKNK